MQYTALLLAALTALSTGVSGLALPALFSREKCIEDLPQYQQAKANQSTIFGLQLAGSAKDQDELDTTCSDLNDGAYSKWKQEGLVLNAITQPICNPPHPPNATLTLPNLATANTHLLTALLLTAFPSQTTKSYLCTTLRYPLLDSLLLNSDTIIATLCNATTTPQAPQPFTSPAQEGEEENSTAVADLHTAAANLFAYTYASGLTTPSALSAACASASARKSAWGKLMLNGTAVEEVLCSIKSPLKVDVAKARITEWSSRWFGTVLGGVSDAEGFKGEVCRGLSCGAMGEVGFDGEVVRGVFGC
ncbi:hypothetical protein M409DRAFT_16416 [Zasmidium cellare ATCC 36951]|uniref:Uncharacterized protein n=1 Tax=Zasmidium cellare ATCC 36951 TaxID=1080233 RepID=A0A6A6D427_ZASCE|nr:uncharacterized protein M409DRAFT_16416 [Zasmidium cellare ATCC 36951]KAF2174147.1 hypothetical protein M409DRAFT_16416 [Zasmidium cellare ATCC 36951]